LDALDQARRFLRAVLMDGKQPAVDILAHGRSEGHSDRTLQRAAREERVTKVREGTGLGSKSYWSVPDNNPEE
jgi:hypothetical protein